MQFTKLRLSGFKSFSDPVELAIDSGLTGVVGPNGCGKSNIVEALRWVMGESSARGLRGAEMDEVIFNGTGSRAGYDVAEVRLSLTGRAGGLPFVGDVDDLEIARRIARGQGSVYRLNGREVRARDVQLLLADAGSGARSPAIVGQGQIGFIVDAKPEERRRLLEDAAGIGGLHGRRREAEAKLRETATNLQRVTDLVQAQQAHLAEVVRQDRQAERYRAISAELRAVEETALLAHFLAAQTVVQTARERQARAAARDRTAQAASDGLHASQRRRAELLPPLRAKLAAAREEAAALTERRAQREAVTAQHRAHAETLARAVAEGRAEGERLCATAAAVERDAADAEMRLQELPATLAEKEAARAAAAAAAEDARQAAALAEARRQATAAAEAEALRDVTHTEGLVEAAASRLAALDRERAGLDLPEEVAGHEPAAEEAALRAAIDRLAEAEAALTAVEVSVGEARGALAAQALEAEAAQAAAAALDTSAVELDAAVRLREARTSDLTRRWQRHRERDATLTRRRRQHEEAAEALDVDAEHAAAAVADAALATADATLDRAREVEREAAAAEQAAVAARREALRAQDTVQAEIEVLAKLAVELPERAVFHDLLVPAGLERAVAAALGDDLLVSTDPTDMAYWAGLADEAASPPLPDGAVALSTLLVAPPVLHGRLVRVGVVAFAAGADALAALQPGQRLVDRAGNLWRWDGLVRGAEAETPASARLRHRFRLEAARAELAGVVVECETAERALAAAEAAHAAARASLAADEQAWRGSDAAQLRARQRMDAAEEAAARLAAEAAAVAAEGDALAAEAAELTAADADLGADRAGELAAMQDERHRAHLAVKDAQGARQTAQVAVDEADRRRAEAVLTVQRCRHAVEDGRSILASVRAAADAEVRRRGELRAAHDARVETIERELERLRAALAGHREAAAAALAAAAVASAAVAEAAGAAELARASAETASSALADLDAVLAELRQAAVGEKGRLEQARRRQAEVAALLVEVDARRVRLEGELAGLPAPPGEHGSLDGRLAELEVGIAADDRRLREAEAELAAIDRRLGAAAAEALAAREEAALATAAVDHAAADHRAAVTAVRERLEAEPAQLLADAGRARAAAAADAAALEAQVAKLRSSRDRLGPVNLRAGIEAAELRAGLGAIEAEEGELRAAVRRLEDAIGRLNGEGRQRLAATFEEVDRHFRDLFVRLFGGGTARLRLIGAEDPLAAGLELEASPPGKKLASIQLLSGGEKTLTALALVFAFFLANPAPLCVLDEVDAPLDDANVDRFVALMREIAATGATRFLVVTHHPLTMARTDRLYGVTMSERGVSRLVSVALEEAVELRATA